MHQTLTAQAATVVRNAVALARRRGHAQATPLHVAATLLTTDSSLLRRACLQSRDGVTHPGGVSSSASSLQCRALELCFNVALNRLPAAVQGQPASLSNALVAALKRAQAHQRRGCIEQQQHQPLLGVKVEMEQLIISILDDPSVSRVMREAGFYSAHVKNNVEAETLTLTMAGTNSSGLPFTVSSSSEPQNIIRPNTDEDRRNYTFFHRQQQQEPKTPSDLCFLRQKPVMVNSEFLYSQGTRSKDIEFLIQALVLGEKRKNIVVVGEEELYTESVVRELIVRVESGNVPEALKSVRFIIPQFSGFWNEVELKLAELSRIIESFHDHGSNCIVYVGDLAWTLENHEREEFRMDSRNRYWYSPVGLVVKEVGRMLGRYADRLWLLGTATYHTYMRCNTRWPSLESEWGLQTLIVPAGGLSLTLFSSAIIQDTKMEDDKVYLSNESESELQITSSDDDINNCCAECSANFVVEARILDHNNSVITRSTETEMPRNNLLYWLPQHKNEESSTSTHQGTDSSERLRDLHKKWHQKCRSVHPKESRQIYQSEMKMKRQNFSPSIMVSGVWEEPRVMQRSPRNSRESYCITSNSSSLICSNQNEPISSSTQCPWPSVMGSLHSIDSSTRNFLFENNASGSHQDRKLEVDTTLALGRSTTTGSDHENTISDKLSSVKDVLPCTKPSNRLCWQNTPSSPDSMSTSVGNDNFGRNTEMSNRRYMKFDLENLRILCKGLKEKVKWQSKITQAIATTVLRCRSGMARRQGGAVLKRDAWLLFLGPDKMGKRKMARGLAEIVYGSEHNFACIGMNNFNSIDHKNQDLRGFRGIRTLERLAELVRLDPHSVVLLEEIEQADTAVISSLVNAMETGKLLDPSGREVSISDAIIIMTSSLGVESHNTPGSSMDEDRLLSIMETNIKLLVIAQASTNNISPPLSISKVSIVDCKQYSKINYIKDQRVGKFPCKRKADCLEESTANKSISKPSPSALDLNYSAENFIETCGHTGASQDDCDLTADELYVLHFVQEYFSNNFFKLIDKTLVFQPFEFEQLEECLLEELNNAFSRVTGGNGCLQIDRTLMDHFVAASSWQCSSSPVQIFSKWVEDVFMDGLVKLLSVHKVSSDTVIRLIAVEKTEHSNSYLNSTLPTNFDILFS